MAASAQKLVQAHFQFPQPRRLVGHLTLSFSRDNGGTIYLASKARVEALFLLKIPFCAVLVLVLIVFTVLVLSVLQLSIY